MTRTQMISTIISNRGMEDKVAITFIEICEDINCSDEAVTLFFEMIMEGSVFTTT